MKKIIVILISVVLSSVIFQGCAPTNPHLTEAKISMNRDDMQKAQKELALVLEQQPENIEAAYLEGYIHFKQENWSKMYDSFYKVKTNDPEYEKANIENMSIKAFGVLRSTGINDKFNNAVPLINVETEKAEKLFQSALNDLELADKFKSDDFITKDIIATINLQLGNKDKAIDGFQEAIPYGNRYISELRESVKKDGDKEGLKEKEIESTFKNIVNAYINIFNLYTEREESEKALEALNKVLEFDPANKEALLQMAKYYENRKEFEKALPMYEKMLEIEPDNIDVLFNQGILFKSSKDIDKAIVNFEKIIGINPDDAETMYFLALFYTEKEQYQKVVNLIEPKFENFSDEWKDKVSDYIQVALVKIGRAIDAKNYQRN